MDNKNESENVRFKLPKKSKNEMFAVVDRRLGGSRMNVSCSDGKSRIARIPGRKKRKMSRIRSGDLIIICPWEIQDEKADIVHRYKIYQAKFLSRRDILPDLIDVF
jgi:translation initiation factor 1A